VIIVQAAQEGIKQRVPETWLDTYSNGKSRVPANLHLFTLKAYAYGVTGADGQVRLIVLVYVNQPK
jgi:hypothetical protein